MDENNTPLQEPLNLPILSKDLATSPAIKLPSTPEVPKPAPVSNFAEQIISSQPVEQTESQQIQQAGISEILKSLGGLQGEAQFKQEQLNLQNEPQKRQELQNINSQILKKQAEINQDDIQLVAGLRAEEKRDTLLPFARSEQATIAGDAQIARALKTAEIGVLNASAIAKQGDISLARQLAQEAIDVKYAPYRENIKRWQDTLTVIEPLLSADRQAQADKQKAIAAATLREIEKEEQREKDINSLALELQKNGADQGIVQSVLNSGTYEEAISNVGTSLAVGDNQIVQLDNGQTVLINKNTGEVVKSFGGVSASSASIPGLTVEDRRKFMTYQPTRQAAARIGIINAVEDYSEKLKQFKGGNFDFNRLTTAEKKELEQALNSTVGSAINVAQGQGAMGDAEAERILGNLKAKRRRRTTVITAAGQGVIDAQKSLLRSDFDFIDSAFPGATDEFEIFADAKLNTLSDSAFFNYQGDGISETQTSTNYFSG